MCALGQENFCHEFPTLTYSGTDRHDSSITEGAYSREDVVREAFAYRLPDGLDPVSAAPLMCAGGTVWEPLRARSEERRVGKEGAEEGVVVKTRGGWAQRSGSRD